MSDNASLIQLTGYFMNINKWTQHGKVYLWQYNGSPKNYIGWHITCDKEGIVSLSELISLMIKSDDNGKRTVNLFKPKSSELKVPNCKSKAIAVTKITILYEADSPDIWDFRKEDERVFLHTGINQLIKFKSGLQNLGQGQGDYSIGDKENKVWFWWRHNE